MIDSAYQTAIYAFAADPTKGNLVVKAGAGSGKTTTIKQLVKRLIGSHIALAFNKPIQLVMEAAGLNARTFHSLCMSVVGRTGRIFEGIGALAEDTEQVWSDLAEHHDLELESERAEWSRAIELARAALSWSNGHKTYDFADALYFCVKDGLRLPQFDNVLVDEGQDTNKIQIAIIRKLMKEQVFGAGGSRLFVFGDDAQAIYGFRGADSNALNNIVEAFNCTVLPLTVSYRCASNIVKFASQYGAIEVAPNAPEGEVRKAKLDDKTIADMKAGDLVICRLTKPVITAAYTLLKARKPAYVMGREIGAGLASLVKKQNAKGIENLITKLNDWTSREIERARAKGQDSKVETIQDKTDALLFLIDELEETDRTIPALLRNIEELFRDKAQAVVLATIHRTKGLEAERVYWLEYDFSSKWARKDWQQQQETNLCYVAATRAKNELVLIPSERRAA